MKGAGVNAPHDCEVLQCNWWGVQVYMRCQHTMLAGMGGAVMLGVSGVEVRSVCELLRVPRREWPETVDVCQALAGLVAKIENERSASRQRASTSRARKRG